MLFGLLDPVPKKSAYSSKKKSSWQFEEAGSFYDRDGNEHIIGDDHYCQDCDDFHDD